MPTPMPTSAVGFIPAASSRPKVSTSTRTATATPMNSVAPIATPVVPKALPPTATSSPASSAAAPVSCSARGCRGAGPPGAPRTGRWPGRCARRGDRLAVEGADHAGDLRSARRGGHGLLDGAGDGGIGHGGAVGATKTICAPTPPAPGEAAPSVSSASCDSDPGIENSSSKEPPTVTSSATTAPRSASQATLTGPRWRKEARPSRARRVPWEEELRAQGGGGAEQERESGAFQVGGGPVAGGARCRRGPRAPRG